MRTLIFSSCYQVNSTTSPQKWLIWCLFMRTKNCTCRVIRKMLVTFSDGIRYNFPCSRMQMSWFQTASETPMTWILIVFSKLAKGSFFVRRELIFAKPKVGSFSLFAFFMIFNLISSLSFNLYHLSRSWRLHLVSSL